MTGYTQPDLLPFPDNYNDPADVPKDMEALARATQAALTEVNTNLQYVAPIGTIVMWPQASAPGGWHLCNGTAHGSDALQSLLGSPNTPNLTSKFIVGAGPQYAVGATGGLDTVTLTAGQSGLRDHAHGASSAGASTDHSHRVDLGGGGHAHQYYGSNLLTAEGDFNPAGTGYPYMVGQHANMTGGDHAHGGQSGGHSADHGHGITVNGSGAVNSPEAHENRPPYYALTYIIRKA